MNFSQSKIVFVTWRSVLGLFAIWLFTNCVLVNRLQTLGAFSTLETTKLFEYAQIKYHTDPGSLRLDQSYTRWALNVEPSDAYNYLRAGLGFADGRGLNIKAITFEDPDSHNYIPYYYQAPGTPVAIGTFIKLFGTNSVLPYFVFVSTVHFFTALLTCFLASFYLAGEVYIFGAGVLSLLCLPVIDSNLGAGCFWSEPLAAPFVLIALISVTAFWKNNARSYSTACVTALIFGASLAVSSYFRDIYTSFVQFSLVILLLAGCFERYRLKQIFVFATISMIVLSMIQQPWKKRNNWYFKEYSMSASTYCGAGLWALTWDSSRAIIPSLSGGIGLGSYLAPEKSAEVLIKLSQNRKEGGAYAFKCLMEAVCRRPWDAIKHQLRFYDVLWFGQDACPYIYLWCVVSSASFLMFLCYSRFKFEPGLWLFPLFLLSLSPIIPYEHRYTHPFFLFVTPITAMYVLKRFFEARVKVKVRESASPL
jgi:hypothetical protein